MFWAEQLFSILEIKIRVYIMNHSAYLMTDRSRWANMPDIAFVFVDLQ